MTYATLSADREHFDQTLLDSIENAVSSVLGEPAVKSLFISLENCVGLTRNEIPRRPDLFFNTIEQIFGPTIGKAVGGVIIKVLYLKLGLEFDDGSDKMPLDYVKDARRKLGLKN